MEDKLTKTITIKVTMRKRWIPYFLSMLKYMQYLGSVGSSRQVTIYSDGDGDFRPKFKFDVDFEEQPPIKDNGGDRLYDAG